MTNQELAQVFTNIAALLEIKGEVIYKILAYKRAAEVLTEFGREVRVVWREGQLQSIPGVGTAIAEKIDELLTTGKLNFYEKLKTEVPETLIEILAVPDVGPKKVAMFWKQLNITTLVQLEQAAKAGKLRGLAGMGEKSEAKILAGIGALARRANGRRPLGQAWPVVQEFLGFLRALPGVKVAEAAGSVRRRRSTIGDLDFLVAAEDAGPIMTAFVQHPSVTRILGQGPTKSSVELANGLQADLRVLPLARFGTLLQYFTGSQAHNLRLRELALAQGLSLNEHAFTRTDGSEIVCATEAEVYQVLGLPLIPPELREDRGEIQAAQQNQLPRLVDLRHLHSDLHTHSTWSDGAASMREMALAAKARGLRCLAVTDHSQSLGVANGLTPERLRAQRQEITALQAELGMGFHLLQGSEVEIRADGQLDFSDDDLADLDIVVASLHTSLRQPREQITARLLRAIENRHVDIIGHPTGRLLPDREGADLDMEVILRAAAANDVVLEINANPARLDLDDVYARRALELGCKLAIDTDAHHPGDFELAHFGVGVARRAWATPENIINTWPAEKLLQWLEARNHRRPVPTIVTTPAPVPPPAAETPPPTQPKSTRSAKAKPAAARSAPKKPKKTAS